MSIASMLRRAPRPGTAQATTTAPTSPAPLAPAPTTSVDENGSFAFATCDDCGWRGPGRRARSTAAHDGDLHALTGCGV